MSFVVVGALAGAFMGGGVVGAWAAWWAHRRTALSAWNFYLLSPVAVAAWAAVLLARRVELLPVVALLVSASLVGASVARRFRLAALGAGGELREYERARRMLWTPRSPRHPGQPVARTRIESQGELVRERSWPPGEPFVP